MNEPPLIVVVGSPNAGKSTLVNRLSGSRQAVVHETPGVTRDRKEVEVEWCGRRLTFVDTGGYDTNPESPFAGHIREQVELAIAAADIVLFVVDGRAGMLADDHEIATVLRRAKLPVVLIANKVDDPRATTVAAELYGLGLGEPWPISALHGLGSGDLLDHIVSLVGDAGQSAGDEAPAEIPVALVGRPNAGKSSLFNAIVGEPRTIVSELAGTTRDAIDTSVTTPAGSFRFIDTAGMRKAAKVSGIEYYAYLRSVQSLDRAHVAVVVVDGTLRFGELDLSIAGEAAKHGCATIIAVNKTDLGSEAMANEWDDIIGMARRKLRQRPPVLPVSAASGRGVRDLLAAIADLHEHYVHHLPTAELNRALATIAAERPLPMKRGKRLKMYYLAQFATSPPRFAIEVNDRTLVTRDYGYFVENRLRERFGLQGVPVVIDFKGKR